MNLFLQQVFSGLASGGIYASMALAIVMIYRAIDHLNFAQGEMAMFSTYIAWQLMSWGLTYWVAFLTTVFLSFLLGVFIERVVFKPIHDAPALSHIVVFIGLLAIFNSVAGTIWDFSVKPFPSPFPEASVGDAPVGAHDLGMIGVTIVMLLLVYAFFRFSNLGLAMRAAAQNPESARLVGVRVRWMTALGWGFAASIGAVAGMMIAHKVFLDPNMMLGILLYGFAGAVVGGVDSPVGAVVGGFLVGVVENLCGTYVPGGAELKLTLALVLIVAVLMVKPNGLFGRPVVRRV